MSQKKKIIIFAIALMGALCIWQVVRAVQYLKACDAYDKALEAYHDQIQGMEYVCDKNGYIDKLDVDIELSKLNEGENFEPDRVYFRVIVKSGEETQ